jgi:hypothetical protein
MPLVSFIGCKAMPSIALEDVCVDLPIYNSKGRSLKSAILAQTVGGGVAEDRDRSVVVIRALDHVSLHLEHSARVALIGANGSGKTTLASPLGFGIVGRPLLFAKLDLRPGGFLPSHAVSFLFAVIPSCYVRQRWLRQHGC